MQLFLSIILSGFTLDGFGQIKIHAKSHSGIEWQQYPTGLLFGVYHAGPITDHLFIDVRAGYNLVRHGDAGVHDDERGGGFGGSGGIYWTTGPSSKWPRKAWIFGIRSDLWHNKIDWKDFIDLGAFVGSSKVIVLQPTTVIGYQIPINDRWQLTPTLALGAEINIKVEGAEVGEGAIFLWGLRFTHLW